MRLGEVTHIYPPTLMAADECGFHHGASACSAPRPAGGLAELKAAFLSTAMVAGAAAVALIVAAIGIMNLMLVSVHERRQEIGLRMAVGARRTEIACQFLIEAGLIALIGSAAGVALAFSLAVALGALSEIAAPVTALTVVGVVAAATLVTLISALYPARKAASLDPAVAFALDG